ncbi:tannase and feruloyl esterase-domain-containing protein [Podospora aff. communis PSN243]|uniref:Carboxylic ester hydrolase n=1 Tax=Podospora aff. communis PSN243 TaxID=3040156 RepID=A0AAV9G5W3_9PEZI|nr:tannase and feruloyl esterase-domain-containing protein [Podospora aff. communis PSN243]
MDSLSAACTPPTFSSLQIFGAEILNIQTRLVTNFSASVSGGFRFFQPSIEVQNASFCNVTVTYTHPGQGDEVFAHTWLPIGNWNGRLHAVGGSGWAAGATPLSFEMMAGAIGDGYAAITSDAGLTGDIEGGKDWALLSPGNPNLYKLNNLGSISVNEQSIIGKSLIRSFYGKPPTFSYFSGCSQGGRQGIMAAQRFPTAFDGIAAAAPVIDIPSILAAVQWPQQVMNILGHHPHPCELDALTTAALSACDPLDGTVDGIITDPTACLHTFNPFSLVNTTAFCPTTNTTLPISHAAAAVANATWHGPHTPSGKPIWYGIPPGADLTGNDPSSHGQPGIAATNCTPPTPSYPTGTCTGTQNFLSAPYLSLLVARGDPTFNISALSMAEFSSLIHAGQRQFSSFATADDPDLSAFRDAGGKMVTFHGLADQIVSHEGTRRYYRSVQREMGQESVEGFYRHFEIPGLAHCFGGRSGSLPGMWEQLVRVRREAQREAANDNQKYLKRPIGAYLGATKIQAVSIKSASLRIEPARHPSKSTSIRESQLRE